MSSSLSLVLAAAAVLLIWIVSSRLRRLAVDRVLPAHTGTAVADAVWFLRFGDDLGASMRDTVRQSASGGELATGSVREVALALARASGSATHGYAGEASGERVPAVCAGMTDGAADGTVVGLRVRSRYGVEIPAPPGDANAFRESLRTLAAIPSSDLVKARLVIADISAPASDVPGLVAFRAALRPGQIACRFCGAAMPSHETQCQQCGGRAVA